MNLKMSDDALFNLRWDAQRSALLGSVATLFREEAFVDTTVVSDGQIFKAHKLLLSASSSYLKQILESVPSQHAVLFMPHISSSDLGNVLKFIYEGEIKINRRALKSFLAAAKLLRIKGMDFDLDEDLDSNISAQPSSVPPSATPASSSLLKRSILSHSASAASSSGALSPSEDELHSVNNIPPQKKSSSNNAVIPSLKHESRGLVVNNNEEKSINQNTESRNNSGEGKPRTSNANIENSTNGNTSTNQLPDPAQQDRTSSNNNPTRSENSRHGSGTSSVSDAEMGIMEDSNHSSRTDSHPLINLPEHLMDGGIDMEGHHDDDEHNEHDPNMENEMDNEYDDDEDQNFSMSMHPEVSLRESDESYSILDRHQQPIRLKAGHNLSSFSLPSHGQSGLTVSATPGSSSSSPYNSSGLSLRNIHKLRPLVPKTCQTVHHSSGQTTSQAQAITDGILMRMMREPLHSSKSGAPNSSSLASFFDMGHNDTSHPGGLRKQKRYVQCTSCSKVLSSLSALKRHMEDVHCARIQGKCIICGRVYSSRNSLLTHVYSAHKKHHDYKAVARIIRESDFEQFATA